MLCTVAIVADKNQRLKAVFISLKPQSHWSKNECFLAHSHSIMGHLMELSHHKPN